MLSPTDKVNETIEHKLGNNSGCRYFPVQFMKKAESIGVPFQITGMAEP
jgi:hypothetical protein